MKKLLIFVGAIFLLATLSLIILIKYLPETKLKEEAIKHMEYRYDAKFVVDHAEIKRRPQFSLYSEPTPNSIVEGRVVGGRLENLPTRKVRLELSRTGWFSFRVVSDDYKDDYFNDTTLNHPTTLQLENQAKQLLEKRGYLPTGYDGQRYVEKQVVGKFRDTYYSLHVQSAEKDVKKLKEKMKELMMILQGQKPTIREIYLQSNESNPQERKYLELCIDEPESVDRFFREEKTLSIGCTPRIPGG